MPDGMASKSCLHKRVEFFGRRRRRRIAQDYAAECGISPSKIRKTAETQARGHCRNWHIGCSLNGCRFICDSSQERDFYAQSKFKLDTRIKPEIRHFILKCVVCRRRLDS